MSQVQAQTKGLALLWRFAQPPLRYRQPKRILAIRERTPPSVWFGDRVQLPAEVSWQERNNAARLCRQTANERRAIVLIRVDSWLTSCAGHRTRGHCALSAMLTVSQLSKSFAGRALFDDVSLQVNRGDRIGSGRR